MDNIKREAVKARLAEIERANGGRLSPADVVDDAKRKDSPLHDLFDWDVNKAAMAHWMHRAREIIVSVRVVVTVDKKQISSVYYVRDPSAASDEQGYVSVPTLRSDEDMARAAIVEEFKRAGAVLARARELAEVLGVEREVDGLIEQVSTVRSKVQEHAAQ